MKLKNNIHIEFSDKLDFKLSNNKEVLFMCKTNECPELFENIDLSDFWDKNKCDCQERVTCYYCDNFLNKNGALKLSDKKFCCVYKKHSKFKLFCLKYYCIEFKYNWGYLNFNIHRFNSIFNINISLFTYQVGILFVNIIISIKHKTFFK